MKRNFILLLRHIISSKNTATWKSTRDLRYCPKNSAISTGIFPLWSVCLIASSVVMVEFPSAVNRKRSLKVIILKWCIALKIITLANVLDLFVFWNCCHFSKFQWHQFHCQIAAQRLAKIKDFKRKGLELIRVLEI